jgi:hypothetical protein
MLQAVAEHGVEADHGGAELCHEENGRDPGPEAENSLEVLPLSQGVCQMLVATAQGKVYRALSKWIVPGSDWAIPCCADSVLIIGLFMLRCVGSGCRGTMGTGRGGQTTRVSSGHALPGGQMSM